MKRNIEMLLEKVKNGEDTEDYIFISDHTLYDLREAEIMARYIKITERYRREINKTDTLREMATLAIECIAKITGDKLFAQGALDKINEL